MSLLLAPDSVALYAPQGADGHGWAQLDDSSPPVWEGAGNLQRSPGRADARAADAGGHGPADPAHSQLATLYLPMDAPVADGAVVVIGGQRFALSQARKVTDPTGSGWLDCWAATATGVDTYGGA